MEREKSTLLCEAPIKSTHMNEAPADSETAYTGSLNPIVTPEHGTVFDDSIISNVDVVFLRSLSRMLTVVVLEPISTALSEVFRITWKFSVLSRMVSSTIGIPLH